MKKLLLIIALVVAGGVNAQELSREMTIALKNNDVAAVSALVTDANKNDCIQVGRTQSTLLHLSIQMGSSDVATHLIDEKNVDINKACGDYTPLMWAAKNSTPEVVAMLINAGADKTISIDNKDAMHYAQYYNRTEIIALLSN